jgi:hypothetical protein
MRCGKLRNMQKGETMKVIKILEERLTGWVSNFADKSIRLRMLATTFGQVYAAALGADSISSNMVKQLYGTVSFGKTLALVMLTTISLSCQQYPKWQIKGGNPPQFVVAGSGHLQTLRVHGPQEKRTPADSEPYGMTYWEIRSADGYDLVTNGDIAVSYGEVPAGFVQVYPSGGVRPLPLFEGGRFALGLVVQGKETVNALFTIHQNTVVVERN